MVLTNSIQNQNSKGKYKTEAELSQTSTKVTTIVYLINSFNTRNMLSPICRALIYDYVINIHLNIIIY